jgi:hypothetical protein
MVHMDLVKAVSPPRHGTSFVDHEHASHLSRFSRMR